MKDGEPEDVDSDVHPCALRQVLHERARALAAPVNATVPTDHHLVVIAAGQRVLVPATRARHVVRAGRLAAVPGTPRAVVGVAAVLGEMVPVVELAALLGLAADVADVQPMFVIVDDGPASIGLLVDAVEDIIETASPDHSGPTPLNDGLLAWSHPDEPPVLDVDALRADARLTAVTGHPEPREGAA